MKETKVIVAFLVGLLLGSMFVITTNHSPSTGGQGKLTERLREDGVYDVYHVIRGYDVMNGQPVYYMTVGRRGDSGNIRGGVEPSKIEILYIPRKDVANIVDDGGPDPNRNWKVATLDFRRGKATIIRVNE